MSSEHPSVAYPPLNVLKPVTNDVWIVDGGPLHTMGLAIPLRMTVIRLNNGEIWLHSPTPYVANLKSQIERLGPIRHLVAPNSAHWSFLRDWHMHCSGAITWAAPGLRKRTQVRNSGLKLDRDLGPSAPEAWAVDIDQMIVPGGFGFVETAFFHRASSTLVLTDLIENFETSKVNALSRPLLWLAGVMAPDGKTPAHLRFVINRKRSVATKAAQQLVDWKPERVIFSHGKWFDTDAAAQLRRSLAWLIGGQPSAGIPNARHREVPAPTE